MIALLSTEQLITCESLKVFSFFNKYILTCILLLISFCTYRCKRECSKKTKYIYFSFSLRLRLPSLKSNTKKTNKRLWRSSVRNTRNTSSSWKASCHHPRLIRPTFRSIRSGWGDRRWLRPLRWSTSCPD